MMLYYARIVEWRYSVTTVTLFVAVLALYYAFLKNSDRGRD